MLRKFKEILENFEIKYDDDFENNLSKIWAHFETYILRIYFEKFYRRI